MNERKKTVSIKESLIVTFTIILPLFSGCVSHSTNSVEIVSIMPNKQVYYLGDHMKLNVTLKSSNTLENVTISATGLKNRVGQTLLHESKVVTLAKGTESIIFKYYIPSCPCKHLDPGTYPINITVSHNGEIIVQSIVNIQLEER